MDPLYALLLKGMPDEDLEKYTKVVAKQVIEYVLLKVNTLEKNGIQPTSRRIASELKDLYLIK